MYKERKTRSIVKTLSWRILATLTTICLVYVFTGKFMIAASIGGIEVVLKLILYFFHERVWDKVKYGRQANEPFVLWLTGLSGAGKSTIANKLYPMIKAKGFKVERLDGDVVREIFPHTGFTKEDRDNHVKRIGYLASLLEKNGVTVICSFVSPYREARRFVRGLCRNFVEVYVNPPLEVCEQRDVKGLYKKARSGEIKNFTGIDDPYEPPEAPELDIDTSKQTLEKSCAQIIRYLDKRLK